jgi:serine/threonine-protein kinase
MTDPTRLETLLAIFGDAIELPAEERAAFVATACASHPDLADELEAMFAALEPGAELELERELVKEAPDALRTGAAIGPFRIIRALGRGGMGEVYLAERTDSDFEHLVAIKVLRAGLYGEETVRRFERERSILARLRHAAVVPLIDGGVADDGRPYLVMQYVEGEPICVFADSHRLPLQARLELFVRVARAVEYAHSRLVIHRDLKPSNILVTPEGDPRLLDFGVAKLLEEEDSGADLTRQGRVPLTPERAAPEQLRGEPPATATDVWALGVLLYELLTGNLPYRATTPTDPLRLLAEITTRDLDRPSRAIAADAQAAARAAARSTSPAGLRRALRGDLDTIVAKALQPELERRYAGPGALADDVEAYLAGRPISARPDTLGYRLRRLAARHRAATAATVLAAASLIGLVVVTTLGQHEARRAEAAAREAAERAEVERAAAAATLTFLVDLFRAADPRRNPGLDLTARELLERGVERLAELDDQPAVQAQLFTSLGDVYWSLGESTPAEDLLRRGLLLRSSGPAADPKEHVALLSRLGGLLREQSRFEEAEARFREALAILEREGRLGTPEEVTILNNFGIVLVRTNQLDEADATYRRAIELMERHMAEEPEAHQGWSSNIANLWVNLATVANSRGRFQEAEEATLRALEKLEQQLPENHPNFAVMLNNLGHFAAAQGELAVAIARGRRAVAINQVALPQDHPAAASHRLNLGRFLVRAGRIDEAEPELHAALEVFEAKLGSGSYDATRPLGWLGIAALVRGDADTAGKFTDRAIAIIRASPDHPSAARDLPLLLRRRAAIALRAVDLPMARAPAAESVSLSIALERNEDTAVAELILALTEHRAGAHNLARTHFERAERLAACASDQPCALDRAEDLVLQADWWLAEQDPARARAALERAIGHPGWTSWMLEGRLEGLPAAEAASLAQRLERRSEEGTGDQGPGT